MDTDTMRIGNRLVFGGRRTATPDVRVRVHVGATTSINYGALPAAGTMAGPDGAQPPASAVDGSSLAHGAGGAAAPAYAKPLLFLMGERFTPYVAGASAVGAAFGYALAGPLWALAGLLGGNLAGRAAAKVACDASSEIAPGGSGDCDYRTKWFGPNAAP